MRILVVEDERGIANFVRDGLSEEGFAVDVATDGTKGREMALTHEYDLILLDWLLPGLTGIDVCREIRKVHRSVRIIFLTAKDTLQDAVQGLSAGANDYIRKPFHFEELLARVRAQLRDEAGEATRLKACDIVMDLDTHTVTRGGQPIPLTPKEYSLLEFLLRNKGKVCTRTRIIEHVWDIHFESDTSVIDVYINYLRKKLDKSGRPGYIETIRGVGYVIREAS